MEVNRSEVACAECGGFGFVTNTMSAAGDPDGMVATWRTKCSRGCVAPPKREASASVDDWMTVIVALDEAGHSSLGDYFAEQVGLANCDAAKPPTSAASYKENGASEEHA